MKTTPLRPQVRLRDPGDLIAAVPHLLGFHPIESLVLVTLHGSRASRVGLTLRTDLPPPGRQEELVAALMAPVRQHDATAACLVVVGGGSADPPGPPHRQVVGAVDRALAGAGVLLATRCGWRPRSPARPGHASTTTAAPARCPTRPAASWPLLPPCPGL